MSDEKEKDTAPGVSGDAADGGPKVSRSQLKKQRKALQEKERRLAVAEELTGAADPRRDESEALQRRLRPLHLLVSPVLSDGNCLFRAVAEQLPPSVGKTSADLRRLAAGHIRNHLPLYLPFLTREEDGEVMTEKEAVEYCGRLAVSEGGDIVWGGHAEIVALTGALHRAITVYSAEGSDMRVLEEGVRDEGEDLRISFHQHYYGLGNHYNAVVKRTENDEVSGEDSHLQPPSASSNDR